MSEAGRLIGPLQSLLLKLGLLTIVASLVLWIGWTTDERLSIGPIETDLPQAPPSPSARGQAEVRAIVPIPSATPSTRAPSPRAVRAQTHVATLDLNRATSEQLQGLPGIGEALAQRVIDRRDAKGRFHTIDDLLEVKGIGPKRLAQLRPLLTIGSDASQAELRPRQKPL